MGRESLSGGGKPPHPPLSSFSVECSPRCFERARLSRPRRPGGGPREGSGRRPPWRRPPAPSRGLPARGKSTNNSSFAAKTRTQISEALQDPIFGVAEETNTERRYEVLDDKKKKRGRLLHESMAVDSWHPSVSLMCDCTHPTLAAWFSLSACKGPFMASSCVPVLNEDGLEGSLRVGNLKGP